ncbi:MAG: ArsR/SmtB family transcription factor [Ilumatobacter sp.]
MTDPVTTPRDRARAAEGASWCHALGDPTRVLILHLLATGSAPLTVGQITEALDVGQSTVSHHLAKLADVGFVVGERVAASSRWSVNRACLAAFPSAAEMVMGNVPAEFTTAIRSAR